MKKLLRKIKPKSKPTPRQPLSDCSDTEGEPEDAKYHALGTTAESRKAAGITAPGVVAHGLFVLHPPQDLPYTPHPHTVDIVAVHGLKGKARGTWRDRASGMIWLEDFLPRVMPDARIMTFGYDSSLMMSHSKATIEDFARDLLNRLWMLRRTSEALVLAHEDNLRYGDIVKSTTGIVFMGTPHQGSNIADWTSFLTNSIQIVSGNRIVRNDLLKDLRTHSSTLLEISKSFLPRSSNLAIMSFVETQVEPPLTVLVVPKESSQLGLPTEMVFPVNTHHRNICRYPSAQDQTYLLVEASLQSIVSGDANLSPKDAADHITKQVPAGALGSMTLDKNQHSGIKTLKLDDLSTPGASASAAKPSEAPATAVYENDDQTSDERVSLVDPPDGPETITIKINGLKPRISATARGWEECSRVFSIPGDTEYKSIQEILEKEAQDLTLPHALKFPGRSSRITDWWVDCFTFPVRVTTGRPCYNESAGYQINNQQTIAAFFSKVFPRPMNAKIQRYQKGARHSKEWSHSVAVGRDDASALQISFMRTLRVRGQESEYEPPEGLGTFPLFNTQPYRDQLPPQAAAQGGLFLPIYNKEAMYITFDCKESDKFAVRPFLGGVNGISGDNLINKDSSSLSRQDYIVAPQQKRLDGIAVWPGVTKQFVAMEMNPNPRQDTSSSTASGSNTSKSGKQPNQGGTIEYQMTGKDEIGGIQFQIIPQFDIDPMFAGSTKDVSPRWKKDWDRKSYQPVPPGAITYDVLKTPAELGLDAGSTIHIKHLGNVGNSRPKRVADLAVEAPETFKMLELEVFRNPGLQRVFSVTSGQGNRDPVLFKVDADDKFEDIQAAAREVLQYPDGILHVSGLVANNPDVHIPVTDWGYLSFLIDQPTLEADLTRERTYSHTEDNAKGSSTDTKLDMILMPRISKRICHVDLLGEAAIRFNAEKPLLLELEEDTTIGSLRQTIESITGKSTSGLRIASPGHPNLSDDDKIFNERNIHAHYAIPSLVIDEGLAVRIVSLNGDVLDFCISPEDTIEKIKKKIWEKNGMDPYEQRLIFNGKPLEDGKVSQNNGSTKAICLLFGFDQFAKLILVKRLRGGGGPPTTVLFGDTVIFQGYVNNVADLKIIIFRTHGYPIQDQYFELPDDFVLWNHERTLRLTVYQPGKKGLGIGVGGNIVQKVIRDESDPRMWDIGSSKILYVHLVNSKDFKAITGLSPPSAPISRNARLLDIGLYDDEEGEGISADGAFDKLVSLEEMEEAEGHGGAYWQGSDDRRVGGSVPGYPLTLLEPDQTLPLFRAVGIQSSD
ncbi:hypothetical protein NM208_g4450 [Fusarium decemcellulare]|uniref:Uncharacterized protein n=2 Tax=Fusarium decemcellulare TaxID=57161 RepID=A0ACC1SE14_9HYPO|nr:hypothetical protein NM208_g6240 [Fusarium decemcellulare]KAJ3541764.1 hypothetical protein NM208_g4450 [Fusarium decemcellulare]